ncbi:MAG: hypothetical protein MMC33_010687 [Icmadophila ericetorum]|nr:hypothetical protein [Icmadophila ericetorum]
MLIPLGSENYQEWATSLELYLRRERMWLYTQLEAKQGEDGTKWKELADIITFTLRPEIRSLLDPVDSLNGQKLFRKLQYIYQAKDDFFAAIRSKLDILVLRPEQFPNHRAYLVEYLRIAAEIRQRDWDLYQNIHAQLGISLTLSLQNGVLADQFTTLENLVASGQINSIYCQAIRTGQDIADQWAAEKTHLISQRLREENERKRQVSASTDSDNGGVAVPPTTTNQTRCSRTVRFSVSNPEGVPTDLMEAVIEDPRLDDTLPPSPSSFQSPPHASHNVTGLNPDFEYDLNYLMQFENVHVDEPPSGWTEKEEETMGDSSNCRPRDESIVPEMTSNWLHQGFSNSQMAIMDRNKVLHNEAVREEREYRHLFSNDQEQRYIVEQPNIDSTMSQPRRSPSPRSQDSSTESGGDGSVSTVVHRRRITYNIDFLLQFQYCYNREISGKFLHKVTDVITSASNSGGRPQSIMTSTPMTPRDSDTPSSHTSSGFSSTGLGSYQTGHYPYRPERQRNSRGISVQATSFLIGQASTPDLMNFSPSLPIEYRNTLGPLGNQSIFTATNFSPPTQQSLGQQNEEPNPVMVDRSIFLEHASQSKSLARFSNQRGILLPGEFDALYPETLRPNQTVTENEKTRDSPVQELASRVESMARDLARGKENQYPESSARIGNQKLVGIEENSNKNTSWTQSRSDFPQEFSKILDNIAGDPFFESSEVAISSVGGRVHTPPAEVMAISENWMKELERQESTNSVPRSTRQSNGSPSHVSVSSSQTSPIRRTEVTYTHRKADSNNQTSLNVRDSRVPPSSTSPGSMTDGTPEKWKPGFPEEFPRFEGNYEIQMAQREYSTIDKLGWPYPPSVGGAYQRLVDKLDKEVGKNRGW